MTQTSELRPCPSTGASTVFLLDIVLGKGTCVMFWGCLAWKRQNPPFLAVPFLQTASHKTVRSHCFSLPSCRFRDLTGSFNQSIDGQYLRSLPHWPSLAHQSINPTGLVNPTADGRLSWINHSMTVSTLVSPRVRSSQSSNQLTRFRNEFPLRFWWNFSGLLVFCSRHGMSLGYGSMGWVNVWLGCES